MLIKVKIIGKECIAFYTVSKIFGNGNIYFVLICRGLMVIIDTWWNFHFIGVIQLESLFCIFPVFTSLVKFHPQFINNSINWWINLFPIRFLDDVRLEASCRNTLLNLLPNQGNRYVLFYLLPVFWVGHSLCYSWSTLCYGWSGIVVVTLFLLW